MPIERSVLQNHKTRERRDVKGGRVFSDETKVASVFVSTFLSAPPKSSETGTIGKRLKSTMEYVGTVGEGPVRTEKQALLRGPKIRPWAQ